MTDHIIKASKEAGIEFQQHRGITGRVNTMTCGSQNIEALARFYAIAYRAGMERAAEIAAIHSQYPIENDFDRGYSKGSRDASDRIRAEAHAQNQPKNVHDVSVVSKN